jgi:antitoxin PrlF
MTHIEERSRGRIEGKGRVVIPASFRAALGLQVGDEVELRMEDNEIRISTLASRLARSRERLRKIVKPGRMLSDELISERRRAAADE